MSEIAYRLLRADEAEDLVDFIHSIYGPSYPSDLFCDATSIREGIEDDRLFSSIALDSQGRIVGHLASLLERPGDITGDGITGMVAPEARGQNVVSQLGGPLFAAHKTHGILGLHLYAITIHDITQRRIIDNGGVVTGLLLSDWPADISVTGFSTDGLGERLPMLMMYFPLASLPARDVYVPNVYAKEVERIRRDLRIERRIRVIASDGAAIPREPCIVDETRRPRQGCATFRLRRIGSDWSQVIEDWQSRSSDLPAHYVDVSLSSPAAASAALRLRERGWFFGGLLLERAGSDFLRLQCGEPPQQHHNVKLCEPGRRMLDFVLDDRQQVLLPGDTP